MLNLNILQTKYSLSEGAYQLKLPIELGIIIPENDCVRLLSQFVEGLDLTDLYSTYSRHRENTGSVQPDQRLLRTGNQDGQEDEEVICRGCCTK